MGYAHGTRWTDALIEQKIREVMSYLQIDRMPTRTEIKSYYGNSGLAEKLSKVGYYTWADKLGLSTKASETGLGKSIEKFVTDLLINKGFRVEQMSQNFPYDLLVNDVIKIDVKASHLFRGKAGNFYAFSLEKKRFVADFYVFVCLSETGKKEKIYVIPAYVGARNCQFSIGEHTSKYEKYIDRYDLLPLFESGLRKII